MLHEKKRKMWPRLFGNQKNFSPWIVNFPNFKPCYNWWLNYLVRTVPSNFDFFAKLQYVKRKKRKMVAPREFGFELCLKSHAEDIRTGVDIVTILVHWRLLRHSFLCLGDLLDGDEEVPTELLPRNLGWNGEHESYVLRYAFKGRLYICTISAVDQDVIVCLQSETDTRMAKFRVTAIVPGPGMYVNMQKCLAFSKSIDSKLIQQVIELDVASCLSMEEIEWQRNNSATKERTVLSK